MGIRFSKKEYYMGRPFDCLKLPELKLKLKLKKKKKKKKKKALKAVLGHSSRVPTLSSVLTRGYVSIYLRSYTIMYLGVAYCS